MADNTNISAQKLQLLEEMNAQLETYKGKVNAAKAGVDEIVSRYKEMKDKTNVLISDCKKERQNELKPIEEEIKALHNKHTSMLEMCGSVVLYEHGIQVGSSFYNWNQDVTITVSSSGNIYSTQKITGGGVSIPGAVVGGALFGVAGAVIGSRKKVKSKEVVHDNRSLIVSASSAEDGSSASVNPDKEAKLRGLLSRVESVKRRYPDLMKEYIPRLEQLEQEREQVKEKYTAQLDEYDKELERIAEQEQEELSTAQQVFDQALEQYKDYQKKVNQVKPNSFWLLRIIGICGFIWTLLVLGISLPASISHGSIGEVIVSILLAAAGVGIGYYFFKLAKKKTQEQTERLNALESVPE